MADLVEELVQPIREASNTLGDAYRELLKIARVHDQQVLESVNAATPTPKGGVSPLPKLPEVIITGFRNNVAEQITVVSIDGILLDKNAGYDFLLMRRVAALENIDIGLVSGYRTYGEQLRIYNERYTRNGTLNAVGLRKGPAARPGYSNHQMGKSLDLKVDITYRGLQSGATSPVYEWLRRHAHEYGFVNDVSKEPWHWTHPEDRLVGSPTAQDIQVALVNTGALANEALDRGQTGIEKYLSRGTYDRAKAYARSSQMSSTPRSGIFSSQAESSVKSGAAVSSYVAQYVQTLSAAKQDRPEFQKSTLFPLEYDFEKGEWGDSEVV